MNDTFANNNNIMTEPYFKTRKRFSNLPYLNHKF